MRARQLASFALGLALVACQMAPRPLVAGVDACDFCRMTVSDTRFGGEVQSRTGRLHTFDSVECLASFHIDAGGRDDVRAAWVSDFESGRLVPVDSAVFVQDGRVHSPMGRNLVAFAPERAGDLAARYGGRQLSWADVRASIRQQGLPAGDITADTAPGPAGAHRP